MKIIQHKEQKGIFIDKRDGIYLSALIAFAFYTGVPSNSPSSIYHVAGDMVSNTYHITGNTFVYQASHGKRSLPEQFGAGQGISADDDKDESGDETLCYGADCNQPTGGEDEKDEGGTNTSTPTPTSPPVNIPQIPDDEEDLTTFVEPPIIVDPPFVEEEDPSVTVPPVVVFPGEDTGVTEDEITPPKVEDDGLLKAAVTVRLNFK